MSTPLTSPIKAPERIEQPAALGAAGSGKRLGFPLDPLLTLAVLGLGIASVMTLGTATREAVPGDPGYYVDRQAVYLVVGAIFMLVLARIDYARLRPLKNGIYAVLILTILAVLGAGHSANGSQRAISLPFFSFQASELGKVLLILALSAFIVDRARRLRERDTTVRVMLAALVPAMLVIAQPDLGSGMVYMTIAFVLLLVAGTPWRQLAALMALVAVSVAFVLAAGPAVGVHVLKPYQAERLTAFLHPSSLRPGERRRLDRPPLPARGVEDRDRLRPEDRPRRRCHPDPPELRARGRHRLRVRRARRAVRLPRRRPRAVPVRDC